MHGALLAMGNDDERTRRSAQCFSRVLWLCMLGAALVPSYVARADDAAPRLFSESFEYTDVADALDGDDPFDLNVHLGFERRATSDTIEREDSALSAAGRNTQYVPVAQSETAQSSLVLGFDAGIYHDLMLYVRMPLVLSETHSLTLPPSASASCVGCTSLDTLLRDVPAGTAGGSALLLALGPSFQAATRSGVPYLDLGAAWGVMNQYRHAALPTWVLALEMRLPVGNVMKPCAANSGCDAGISRGTTRLSLDSRFSYRVRYFEPYFGVSHAIEWASSGSDRFMPSGDLPGYVDPQPPSVSEATLGIVFVPWEERGRSQRFAIDLRGSAAYVSSGRDYSALFDALGTSSSRYLATYSSDGLQVPSSSAAKLVPFTGLTQVDAHAKLGMEAAAVIQAAQYVRFRLGGSMLHSTAHLLTNAQVCNPDSSARAGDPRSGPCASQLWNPLYRPVIDLPGQRFRSAGAFTFSLVASATAQF